MKKVLTIAVLLVLLTSCATWITGTSTTTTDEAGVETTTWSKSILETLSEYAGVLLPGGLGLGAAAATRIAVKAARTRDALMDVNREAIKNEDWKKINSAASFKKMLTFYQDSHKDAATIAKSFKKWKKKRG